MDNFFRDYMTQTDGRAVSKWDHYFDIYTRELDRLRSHPIRFLEIGIWHGGSIPMWRKYFHPDSHLVFVDINPDCKNHADDGTFVEIGDQSDKEFLSKLAEKHGPFDVIVDDGGHKMTQQITSFESLWPHIKKGGLYMVEDVHTSYWPGFGGGYRNEASFMEYAKRLIDKFHSWYTDQDELFEFNEFAKEVNSVRFFDSIVVIERGDSSDAPVSVLSRNGDVSYSRLPLEIRGRTSIF